MNLLSLPWIEWAIAIPLLGAIAVSLMRDSGPADRFCIGFAGATLVCTIFAWLGFYNDVKPGSPFDLSPMLFGQRLFEVDEINGPLLPAVALLHFLTALATARTKMARFSYGLMLLTESIRLAAFSCSFAHTGHRVQAWILVGLLCAETVPPFIELINRGKPTRVYLLHMGLFIGLLILGGAFVNVDEPIQSAWAIVPMLIAVLIRCGTVPAHCWMTDIFEHCAFGTALLFVTPITGVFAIVRLVLPIAPNWVLEIIGMISLATAFYSAGMAIVQRETRRFFAYLFLSHASLVLVGLELVTELSLTGALCLWFSIILSLGGLGLTLRALEARFGRLSLNEFHGLYEHSPILAVFFLLTGLASVGFPGTLGFISAELLVDGAVEVNPYVGLVVVLAGALNSIAIVKAYFCLFTGRRHVTTVSLKMTRRERFAVLTLAALIIGGGLFPQPGVTDRHTAAEIILNDRKRNIEHFSPGDRDPDS